MQRLCMSVAPRLLKEKVKAILIKSGFEEITQ